MAKEKRSMVSELRSLDLNLLVALRALLDEQHVSRAADKAGLTQSGMSRALKRLRGMFNDPLLVEVDHGYELTARAREMDCAIEKVLTDIQHIMVPSLFDPLRAEGEFRIASMDYELLVLVPSIISVLRERAPGIKVSAVNLGGLDFSPLIRGDVHLAFSPFEQVSPSLYRKRLFEDTKVCLVSTRHSHIQSDMSLDEFKGFDHVWINLTEPDPGKIDETLEANGLYRNITARVPNFQMAARIVAETDLIAIMPKKIASQFIESNLLKIVKLPFVFPQFSTYQYWHDRYNNNPQHQWLRGVISEIARRRTMRT